MNDFINKMGEYWSQLSFDKLGDILTYHHNAPILFSSGLFFFLLLFVATSDFCIAQCMTKTASKWGRKAWVVLSLCVDLGLLGYFKYFNFLREIMAAVAHELGYQLGNNLVAEHYLSAVGYISAGRHFLLYLPDHQLRD